MGDVMPALADPRLDDLDRRMDTVEGEVRQLSGNFNNFGIQFAEFRGKMEAWQLHQEQAARADREATRVQLEAIANKGDRQITQNEQIKVGLRLIAAGGSGAAAILAFLALYGERLLHFFQALVA